MLIGIKALSILFVITALVGCDNQQSVSGPEGVGQVLQTDPQSAPGASDSSATPGAIPFAIFPSQTRQLASSDVIARGETVYESLCRACHGGDLRGGDQGGPNLLRSQVVLGDQHGELIGEVIQNGLSNPGMPEMPPLQVAADDRVAVAEYIHSVWANQSGQGGPPSGEEIELDIVVGDAQAGETFFNQQCTGCHSISGDLQSIASQIPSAENLQNSWVAGRRWGAVNPDADPARRQVIVTVTLSTGETVTGKFGRRDDFVISLTTDSGQYRSFSLLENAQPQVQNIEIMNPLQRHIELLSELTDELMHNVTAYLVTLK
jgi:cytochrome c oxidase cbb3-type subunit III